MTSIRLPIERDSMLYPWSALRTSLRAERCQKERDEVSRRERRRGQEKLRWVGRTVCSPVLLCASKEDDELVGREGEQVSDGEDGREPGSERLHLRGGALDESHIDHCEMEKTWMSA